ncbi:MAG: DUF58 domain-containing protein [Planctomycetota bacterium]
MRLFGRRSSKAPAAELPFSPQFRRVLLELVRRAPRRPSRVDDSGPARRRLFSRSGTFAGHRRYAGGDDVRDIDWHAYARTGALFAKVLQEEERRTLTLLVDLSASLDAGLPPRRVALLRFAAIEGALALARLDALYLVTGNGQCTTLRGAASLDALLAELERAPRAHAPLQMVQRPLDDGHTGLFVWLSDFAPPSAVAPALGLLRRHGRRCVGVLPEMADDRAPDARGVVALRDPESGERRVVRVDAALRQAMAEELGALRRAQDAVFAERGFALVRVPVPPAGDLTLSTWARPWLRDLRARAVTS